MGAIAADTEFRSFDTAPRDGTLIRIARADGRPCLVYRGTYDLARYADGDGIDPAGFASVAGAYILRADGLDGWRWAPATPADHDAVARAAI